MRRVTSFVISAHIALILFLLFSPEKKGAKTQRHIAVRTVVPRPPQKTVAVAKSGGAPQPKAPKLTPKPVAKPVRTKPTVVEKEKKVAKKVSKPRTEEPLAKIEEKHYPVPKTTLDVPQIVTAPPAPYFERDDESLVSFLHDSLNLPEFGEVTIEITIRRDGTVQHLVVKKAESKKNRLYLEHHLPLLRFPLLLDKETTFTLTFCNEIR